MDPVTSPTAEELAAWREAHRDYVDMPTHPARQDAFLAAASRAVPALLAELARLRDSATRAGGWRRPSPATTGVDAVDAADAAD